MADKSMEQNQSDMNRNDDEMIVFYKHHGFTGEWSNVIESTYDLLGILRYCSSEEMNYTQEAKRRIRELHDWIESAASSEGVLTTASNFP